MCHLSWLFSYSVEFLLRSFPLDLLLYWGCALFLPGCAAHVGLVPLLAVVIAGDGSVTSILPILALFLQRVEFYRFGLCTIIYCAVEILSPRIRVLHALMLQVVAVLLVVCPALVGSIGDGVISLASTPFLLYTLGMLFIINVDNKFSLFSELSWQVPIPS